MELILCLKCKRLWPRGTRFCGTCRSSLGVRLCPDDHPSPLQAQVCTTCGSKRLTTAAPSLNLRPLGWLLLTAIGFCIVPLIVSVAATGLHRLLCFVLTTVLPPLITLAIISSFLSLVLGEKVAHGIGQLWLGSFRLIAAAILAAARGIGRLFQRS